MSKGGRAAPLPARAQAGVDVFILNLKGRVSGTKRTRGRKSLPFDCLVHLFRLLLFPLGVMSVRRAGLVLLCAVLSLTRARRSSPEQEDVQEKINSARCTSRCLTLHMTQLTAAFRHLQVPATILSLCVHRLVTFILI